MDTAVAGEAGAARTKGVWALVLSLAGIVCFGIALCPIAIVLGLSANRTLKSCGEAPSGPAKAGVVIGIVVLCLWVLLLLMMIFGMWLSSFH